jgi:PAS domain-containing protein
LGVLWVVGTTEGKLFGGVDVYRVIVDAAEEGIWVADKDDKVTFANKKFVDMLGYPAGISSGGRFSTLRMSGTGPS